MTTTAPTPAGRDLRVAVPLHQELLPNVEVPIRLLPRSMCRTPPV